jgi:hypothetical protein
MRLSAYFILTCSLWFTLVGDLPAVEPLEVTIGPEQILLPGGLQPFMFQSHKGTLVVQAQMPFPPGYVQPAKNAYPGYPGSIRSTDFGKSWKPWKPTSEQGAGPIFEGNVTQLKDGTILIVEWVAEGPQPDGNFIGKLWESGNDWETLKGPFESKVFLPQAKSGFDDGGRPYGGVNFHRTLIEMPNGELLATAYGWFKEDVTPSSYMKTMMKFRSVLVRSKDRGRNWTLLSTIAVDPTIGEEGFCEPVLVRLSQGKHKGRLIAQMRIGSNKALTDPKFNLIHQTESDDGGKTWTRPHPLSFQGVDPDLIEMENGILLAGFGWRTPESVQKSTDPRLPGGEQHKPGRMIGPQHGNYVAFSLDQGLTWSQITQVTHELTTSYVTVREVQPNRLLLVYDKNWWDHKDRAVAGRFIDVRRR